MQKLEESKELVEIKKANDTLLEKAKAVKIVDEKSSLLAGNYLLEITKAKKKAEDLRKFFTQPLNDQVKKINDFFRVISAPLNEVDLYLKRQVMEYRIQLRKEEEKKNAELIKLAKKVGIDKTELDVIKAPDPIKTNTGTVSARKEWKFEVIDETKVPKEYMIVDPRKIREAIKSGVRVIQGVKIYEEEVVTVRNS